MALGEAAGFGTERALFQLAALSHVWAAAPLFLRQKPSLLFLHIFKGLPSPEELLMQMLYGKACPSLSRVFCEHPSLRCCVSRFDVRLRGLHNPDPKNVFL